MKLLCIGTPFQNATALSDPCGQPSKTHLPTHCESERTRCPVSAQPSRTVACVAQPHPPGIGQGYLGKEKSENRLQNLQNHWRIEIPDHQEAYNLLPRSFTHQSLYRNRGIFESSCLWERLWAGRVCKCQCLEAKIMAMEAHKNRVGRDLTEEKPDKACIKASPPDERHFVSRLSRSMAHFFRQSVEPDTKFKFTTNRVNHKARKSATYLAFLHYGSHALCSVLPFASHTLPPHTATHPAGNASKCQPFPPSTASKSDFPFLDCSDLSVDVPECKMYISASIFPNVKCIYNASTILQFFMRLEDCTKPISTSYTRPNEGLTGSPSALKKKKRRLLAPDEPWLKVRSI